MQKYLNYSTKDLEREIVNWYRGNTKIFLELVARKGVCFYDGKGWGWEIPNNPISEHGSLTGFERLAPQAFADKVRQIYFDYKDLFLELKKRRWKLRVDGEKFLQIFIPDAQADFSDLPTNGALQ